MATAAFDTHAYVKSLTAVGVPEPQAEVQAKTLASIIESELATKRDIEQLRHEMKVMEANLQREIKALDAELRRELKELDTGLRRDMKEMELTLRRDMAEMKSDLLKWLIGLLFVQAGFIVALIKLL